MLHPALLERLGNSIIKTLRNCGVSAAIVSGVSCNCLHTKSYYSHETHKPSARTTPAAHMALGPEYFDKVDLGHGQREGECDAIDKVEVSCSCVLSSCSVPPHSACVDIGASACLANCG